MKKYLAVYKINNTIHLNIIDLIEYDYFKDLHIIKANEQFLNISEGL